ncbi:MAG TPA: hypothetical protein VIV11_36310, partial [Kofleriaceae bacterium]
MGVGADGRNARFRARPVSGHRWQHVVVRHHLIERDRLVGDAADHDAATEQHAEHPTGGGRHLVLLQRLGVRLRVLEPVVRADDDQPADDHL